MSQSSQQSSPPLPARSQARLLSLPPELQLQIWQIAIPKPRVLRVALEELPHDRLRAYQLDPIVIPTILHICSNSRAVALKIFRLGFGANTHPRDKTWWNPNIDTLYLPAWLPPPHTLHLPSRFPSPGSDPNIDFHTVEEEAADPHSEYSMWDLEVLWDATSQAALAAVQHLAVPWVESFLHDFGIFSGEDWGLNSIGPLWLKGFPLLNSLTFLVDHYPKWYRTGDILLYEPHDGVVFKYFGESPAEFEWRIKGALDDFRHEFEPEWNPPTIEILILGHRKTRKRNGFCLRYGRGL